MSESLSRPLSSQLDRVGGQGRVLPESIARPVLFSAWAAAIDAALGLHLYLRPAPLGGPFALDPAPYVLRAIYYGIWAHALIGLPYVLLGWWRARRGLGPSGAADATQLAISAALLCLGALDREVQRFLGMHASFAWAATYSALDRTPDVIWSTLRDDRAGAWSSLIGLAVAALYVPERAALGEAQVARLAFAAALQRQLRSAVHRAAVRALELRPRRHPASAEDPPGAADALARAEAGAHRAPGRRRLAAAPSRCTNVTGCGARRPIRSCSTIRTFRCASGA